MKAPDKLLERKIFDGVYDQTLLWVMLCLIGLGFIMIYSATVEGRARVTGAGEYYFVIRQVLYFFLAVIAGLLCFSSLSMKQIERLTPLLVFISLFLLVLVLFIGTRQGITRRWISVFGIFNIQPAEIFKLTVILFMARFLDRHFATINELKKIFAAALIPGLGIVLILLGGDLGSAVIVALITIGMLFFAGLRWKWIGILLLLAVVMAVLAIWAAPYRFERLFIFMHPESDLQGAGYQTSLSLMANARGGLWGKGLGDGVARYYLPELHTDFISSLIYEELGAVFLLCLCLVYFWIFSRAVSIGIKATSLELFYSGYVAKGIAILLIVQALIHIGVNVGVLPTKGLTLPFISYGGSSLFISVLAVALLLRIDFENRRKTLGYNL